MDTKSERNIAYVLLVACLLVGVVAYSAFGQKPPEQPVRVFFTSAAGSVLFTHDIHSDEDEYGIACADCHHYQDVNPKEATSCMDCHDDDPDEYNLENFSHQDHLSPDEYDIACADCHTEPLPQGKGPIVECGYCHQAGVDQFVPKRDDAFHGQCKGCHEEQGGPVACDACHVM